MTAVWSQERAMENDGHSVVLLSVLTSWKSLPKGWTQLRIGECKVHMMKCIRKSPNGEIKAWDRGSSYILQLARQGKWIGKQMQRAWRMHKIIAFWVNNKLLDFTSQNITYCFTFYIPFNSYQFSHNTMCKWARLFLNLYTQCLPRVTVFKVLHPAESILGSKDIN